MVESSETPTPISRAFLPELLKVVYNGNEDNGATWNVVESLELLIDAGSFSDAVTLTKSVISMLGEDRRNRLFQTYQEFLNLIQGGPFTAGLTSIEALVTEIESSGFSVTDRIWAATVLARSLLIGVHCRLLPEGEILRARKLLSDRFEMALTSGNSDLYLKVGLELVRSYINAPLEERPAARQLLDRLLAFATEIDASAEVVFDIHRLRFKVSEKNSEVLEVMRSRASDLGDVASGLVELAVERESQSLDVDSRLRLERATELFEKSAYRSGEFEATIGVARHHLDCGFNSEAYTWYARADRIASRSGFVYGRGVALLGAFRACLALPDLKMARKCADLLKQLCSHEVVLAAFGFNVIGVFQRLGVHNTAITIGTRCEKIFALQGSHALASQAAFMIGASFAELGKWRSAKIAWKRALTCDELRRDRISACERRAAVAHATAMEDFVANGELCPGTKMRIKFLRLDGEKDLAQFSNVARARTALGHSYQIYSQLEVLAKEPLNAIKLLNQARQCFVDNSSPSEVALNDAITGVALIEAAKVNGLHLLDEAIAALERSLEYYSPGFKPIVSWKIRYYLTVACIMRFTNESDMAVHERFYLTARSYLESAIEEAEVLRQGQPLIEGTKEDGEFSPGLKASALQPLKKVLGIATEKRTESVSKRSAPQGSKKFGKYLH